MTEKVTKQKHEPKTDPKPDKGKDGQNRIRKRPASSHSKVKW